MTLKCNDCNKEFPIAARKTVKDTQKFPPSIVDYACCPFCLSIDIKEVKK